MTLTLSTDMLLPAAVLVLWSIIMLFWLLVVRIRAARAKGINIMKTPAGSRGGQLEGVIDDKAVWKAHNFTHLMEQPTIFYPAVIMFALVGAGAFDVALAWIYVILRIIHSVWQATVNRVNVRGPLFILMSLVLTVLSVRLVLALI